MASVCGQSCYPTASVSVEFALAPFIINRRPNPQRIHPVINVLFDFLGDKPSRSKFTKEKEMHAFRKAYCAVIVSDTMGGNSTACAGIIRGCVPVKRHRVVLLMVPPTVQYSFRA